MAVGKALQTNFTAGVLDPKLAMREDVAAYYNGLKNGLNLEVIPQGGVTARRGLAHVRRLPHVMQAIDLSGATITAPAGGTAANAHDGNLETFVETTNNLGATDGVVILHVDFTVPVSVSAIDTLNYSLTAGVLDGEIRWRYSEDNASWIDFGATFNWDSTARTRRRRDQQSTITARYWQLVRIGTTNVAGKARVSEIAFFVESDDLSSVRLIPFAYSTDEVYMMALTGGNMGVFSGFEYHGAIRIPHATAQLPVINFTQSLDTMILFHKDVRPSVIRRQGGDTEFDVRPASFENIPQYDYGAGVGGVDEVQKLSVSGSENGDDTSFLLEGERTERVVRASSEEGGTTEWAARIQAALRALPNTSSDGISVTYTGGHFVVTFSGEDGKRPWDAISVTVLKGNGVWNVVRSTKGKYPGEDIMSDARGWPRCGLFNGSRLHLGGIRRLPDAHLMSFVGDVFNFDIESDLPEKALMFRADTDQVGAIYNIVAGRHLSLFTNDSEFFYPSDAINENSAVRQTTRKGSKEGMRVHEVDGALMFWQGVKDDTSDREIATSVREFIYEETRQSYEANLMSKLASHLIKDPVDGDLRKAVNTNEADVLLMINADGTGVAFTVLRADLVTAFMPIATRPGDRLLAVGVDKRRRVYFAVERIIGGQPERFLEMWQDGLLLDGGGLVTIQGETQTAASDGQAVFSWSFDNPGETAAIGVRLNGGRLSSGDYTVDLDEKEVTLSAAIASGIVTGDTIRLCAMIKTIDGLDYLEGETLDTVIDGTQGDRYTVVDGVLTLNDYADTEIQYGFDFAVWGEFMPLRVPDGDTLYGEKVRIVNAVFDLYETGGLEIRANGGRWQQIRLLSTDAPVLDRSEAEMLYTGPAEARGLKGNAVGAPLEFRRPGPTPFTVLGGIREVSL